ncbi:MAG: putative sugar O-methyltransferase [Bacteroidales bacterium]
MKTKSGSPSSGQGISKLIKFIIHKLLGDKRTRLLRIKMGGFFYKIAVTINPYVLIDGQLQKAYNFLEKGDLIEAAKLYKSAIGLNPNHANVYYIGQKIAKQTKLSDAFYRAILNVIETSEIKSMIQTLINSPEIYQPSKLWLYYMIVNIFQLESEGIENFKRTVNHNYFDWCADENMSIHWLALKTELGWSDSDLNEIEKYVSVPGEMKPPELTDSLWKKYIQLVCMLWEVTNKHDTLKLLDRVKEPSLGNPITISYKGKTITQDICNTVMEVNSIIKATKLNTKKINRIAELGAGHGRVGNILLQTLDNIQIVILDIPPALYISQWYLTNLYPEKSAFKYRDFSNYVQIQEEFEHSSIAFLSPAQIELFPDGIFDLFINISSLQEMTLPQIEMWFNQIDRVCKGWFYTKQYIESRNPFDEIIIHQRDYPAKSTWKEIFNQTCLIQKEFFEVLYRLH